jgi:predicted CXXCH cytochrome family protein
MLLIITVLFNEKAFGQRGKSIIQTMHNLSVSGSGRAKAFNEQEICVFCHTPHMTGGAQTQGWSRRGRVNYITYKSSTLKAAVGQPNGTSRLCLACHDGTVAMGMVSGKSSKRSFSGLSQKMPVGRANLGYDLSDDHPVSFVFDGALAARNGQLEHPSSLVGPVALDEAGRLQCTSCHSPHNNQFGNFLTMDNVFSGLCTTCHRIEDWPMTVHRQSSSTWNGVLPDPWPNTEYTTVAANACQNCHQAHAAGGKEWLLRDELEEENCYDCHNGNVARKNIEREFKKPSRHPVVYFANVHNPDEDPLWASRHVECSDCHNPHAANASPARVPAAPGSLAAVSGVSSAGMPIKPISFEYELCYRCHADNPGREPPVVTRQVFEKNLRLKFRPSNASYHPVENIGRNRAVPSLLLPMTPSSRIYCTDCHNSDSHSSAGGSAPNGPHGSLWSPILERRLVTADLTSESPGAYALCYKCHDRNSILADQSFSEHRRHIVTENTPCTACHDSHGVKDTAHLINFDTTIVASNQNGLLGFEDNGMLAGTCSLKCHNVDHDRRSYPAGTASELLQGGQTNRIRRFR